MCGWESCEIVLASRSNRWRSSSLLVRCSGRTLTATVRSSRVSRALYTSPIPPAPIAERISYGPSLDPATSVMCRPFCSTAVRPGILCPVLMFLLQRRRPVQDDRRRQNRVLVHRGRRENPLAIPRDVVVAPLWETEEVRRSARLDARAEGYRGRLEKTARPEEQLLAVGPPPGPDAAGVGNPGALRRIGDRLHIHLEAPGLVGGVREPPAVG